MVLKECPNYEDCIRIHRDLNPIREPHGEFSCYGCNCYKCYELGFVAGVKETVKKINGCEPILVNKEQYHRDLLSWYRKKLKGE